MKEAYWNEVFGQYKVAGREFNVPGFPEALMSPHFGVKNIFGYSYAETKLSLKLCEFGPQRIKAGIRPTYETLQEAVNSKKFWDFQKKFSDNYEFMKRLLPFLLTLPTPHYHFFIKNRDGIVVSNIVGVADCGLFLFNLTVKPNFRKRGLGKLSHHQIRGTFSDRPAFYWTVHPWFTFDSKVIDYHVIQ
jgi:hypothetical protein